MSISIFDLDDVTTGSPSIRKLKNVCFLHAVFSYESLFDYSFKNAVSIVYLLSTVISLEEKQ